MGVEKEWEYQWSNFNNGEAFLFEEWVHPFKMGDFKDKIVLDCGCGAGDHLKLLSPIIKEGVGIDLNSSTVARKNTGKCSNIRIVSGDIASVNLEKKFDVVYSIGVLHHTKDPTKSFNSLKQMVKSGGRVIVWVYSYEGNFLARSVIEPVKTVLKLALGSKGMLAIANLLTPLCFFLAHTVYRLPISFLPYYNHVAYSRKLSYKRNLLNIFDKLNAPVTHFIKRETVSEWFNAAEFSDVHISDFNEVSWRASGTKK